MELKIHFTGKEIKDFFEKNNYQVVKYLRGSYRNVYGRDKWAETPVPGLIIDGEVVDAEPLFQEIIEKQVRKLVVDCPECG